jgi:FkbM family methyltransferase
MTSSRLRMHLHALRYRAAVVNGNPGNQGHRLRQWTAALRFEAASLVGRSVVLPFANRSKVVARKRGDSSSRVSLARFPDWGEMMVWQTFLGSGDRFFDVGANVGLYTLSAAEVGARVVSFEPASDMVEALTENLRINNLTSVDVRSMALLDRLGSISFAGQDPNRRKVELGAVQVADPRTPDTAMVTLSTLDIEAAGAPPRGIKIDVEGFERLVLSGGSTLLDSTQLELIQLEWNSTCEEALNETREPLARLLVDHGFALYQWAESERQLISHGQQTPPYGRDVFAARGAAVRLLDDLTLDPTFRR